MSGFFLGIDIDKLDPWTGTLSGAIIPVWDPIGKELYKIAASDVLIGSDLTLFPFTAVGGTEETISALHGKQILAVFRGTSFSGTVITTGTPGPFQVKWVDSTDKLTCPDGNEWQPGELLNIIHKA